MTKIQTRFIKNYFMSFVCLPWRCAITMSTHFHKMNQKKNLVDDYYLKKKLPGKKKFMKVLMD